MRPEECQKAVAAIATGTTAMKAAEMNPPEEMQEQGVHQEVVKEEEAADLEVIEVKTNVTEVKIEVTADKREVIEVTEAQTDVQEEITAEKTDKATEVQAEEHTKECIAVKTKVTVLQEKETIG